MPRYYRVSPAIWNEPWDDDMRLLAVYVLTSPHRTTEGLYRLPRPYIEADLGWTPKRIEAVMRRLEIAEFVKRSGDVVLIVNALKYQIPQNPNGRIAAGNAIEGVPATDLDAEFYRLAHKYCEPLAQLLSQRFPERFPHALALPPSLPPASSPSTTVDDVVDESERLRQHLETRYEANPADAAVVAERYANRRAFGAPITDPVAWAQPILDQLAAARREGWGSPGGTKTIEIEGETFELSASGTWELVA